MRKRNARVAIPISAMSLSKAIARRQTDRLGALRGCAEPPVRSTCRGAALMTICLRPRNQQALADVDRAVRHVIEPLDLEHCRRR